MTTQHSTKPVIIANGLHKAYGMDEQTMRLSKTKNIWRVLFGRPNKQLAPTNSNYLWAVNDISLEIKPGETVGIIGRNGAGKTTLMKLLAGIIQPDKGNVTTVGNVQAMINLSAGLSADLTAIANIRNAIAIRGLPRSTTEQTINEILEFAELETRANSLVGTLSSGMRARLGFAINIHMRPDILIIDEALSVGDTLFKQKCLRRLNELQIKGVAMILVSHSLVQVRQFCERILWIDEGVVRKDGPSLDVTTAYTNFLNNTESDLRVKTAKKSARQRLDNKSIPESLEDIKGEEPFSLNVGPFGPILMDPGNLSSINATLFSNGNKFPYIEPNSPVDISIDFTLVRKVKNLNLSLVFYNDNGERLSAVSSLDNDCLKSNKTGSINIIVSISDLPYPPGKYHIIAAIHDGSEHLFRQRISEIQVKAKNKTAWPVPIYLSYAMKATQTENQ